MVRLWINRIGIVGMSFRITTVTARIGLLSVILTLVLLSLQVTSGSAQDATSTLPPTNTPRGTQPTASRTNTETRTPTITRTPTSSKTPTNTPTPQPTMVILGTYITPAQTPITPIPPMAPTPVPSGEDVVTVLLIGSDNLTPGVESNTDTLILVQIDRTAGTVSMMHLARDILVYAPNHSMMKLNTVMLEGNKGGASEGAQLLKDTIQYNFGIKVDFYAHVNFDGFQKIIGQLGGLDISVDCAIQGHRLKSPTLDAYKADSYELYTLPIGYQHLDPYMALWYVRSRGSSSDIDRGRRQMDVLRAMWHQAKTVGLFAQVTQLWPEAQQIVTTDLTLQDVIGLVPFGINLDPTRIQSINVDLTTGYKIWYTPDVGEYTLLMNRDVWRKAVQDFVTPPSANRLNGESPTVEIGAVLPLKGLD